MEFSLWYYCSVENVLWVFREYSSVVRIFLQIFGCSLHAKIYLFYIEWKSILINGYKGAIAITNGFLLLNSRGGCKWFFIQKDISIRLKFKKLICRSWRKIDLNWWMTYGKFLSIFCGWFLKSFCGLDFQLMIRKSRQFRIVFCAAKLNAFATLKFSSIKKILSKIHYENATKSIQPLSTFRTTGHNFHKFYYSQKDVPLNIL